MMRKIIISSLVFLLAGFACIAQTIGYQYRAPLPAIPGTGFYNIPLLPELTSHLKIDYADLRIINDSGRWVPHVLYNGAGADALTAAQSLPFRIAENSADATVLIIQNSGQSISNILVTLKNTSAQRVTSLSGSDDEQRWFVINDSLIANPVPDAFANTGSFRIDFPQVNYPVFRLVIHNRGKDPFDIKTVLYAGPAPTEYSKKFFENPATTIIQKDSAGKSYVRVSQQAPYHFDKISLQVSGSKYFKRPVTLYVPTEQGSSFAMPGRPHESFEISNDKPGEFQFMPANDKVFYLVIDNADNLPVKIDTVKTFNTYAFITTFLEQGKTYQLMLDNENATPPRYDLGAAIKVQADSAMVINAGSSFLLKTAAAVTENKRTNRLLMWGAIIAALFVLLFFTIKMTKEINKKKADDHL